MNAPSCVFIMSGFFNSQNVWCCNFSGWVWGCHPGKRNKILEAQIDDRKFRHAFQGAKSLFSKVAEVTIVLQGNWSINGIGRFWKKPKKQDEHLKMRGYPRIHEDWCWETTCSIYVYNDYNITASGLAGVLTIGSYCSFLLSWPNPFYKAFCLGLSEWKRRIFQVLHCPC